MLCYHKILILRPLEIEECFCPHLGVAKSLEFDCFKTKFGKISYAGIS